MASRSEAHPSPDLLAFMDRTNRLAAAETSEFAREYLLKSLFDSMLRLSGEGANPSREQMKELISVFEELIQSDDWIDPRLIRYLELARTIALSGQFNGNCLEGELRYDHRKIKLIECATSPIDDLLDNRRAGGRLPSIDTNIAIPAFATGLVGAFSDRIDKLKQDMGINHLVFVHKSAGAVGAISMMSSLVQSSRLNACVYRESYWNTSAALSGFLPNEDDRILIVHDLFSAESIINAAADDIRRITGGKVVATLVLCAIGNQDENLCTQGGQAIHVEALKWKKPSGPALADTSRNDSEVLDRSVSRTSLREAPNMRVKRQTNATALIPPGTYSPESMPSVSADVGRLLSEIRGKVAAARESRDQGPGAGTEARNVGPLRGIRPQGRIARGINPLGTERPLGTKTVAGRTGGAK